jgi:hypothetical protein
MCSSPRARRASTSGGCGPRLFAAGLWSDPGNQALRSGYASFGGQADLHFSILHRYDMTLSVGYAVGYSGTQRSGSEWMVSLKIM